MSQRPTFTLAEAANLVGVSRSSVRRRLDQGAFSNAYKTPRGIWKIPLPDLLEAGLKPVSGAPAGVSHDLSGDISQGQTDIGHDISQREQHELKTASLSWKAPCPLSALTGQLPNRSETYSANAPKMPRAPYAYSNQ